MKMKLFVCASIIAVTLLLISTYAEDDMQKCEVAYSHDTCVNILR